MVMCLFRTASLIRSSKILIILFFWYLLFYRFFVEWVLAIELHWNFKVGPNLRLLHGQGCVINGQVVMGQNCSVRHLTTIGNKQMADGRFSNSPRIGNNVDIGANAIIIGDITIGDNVVIGAGSVITKSIPANSVVVGNPGKILKTRFNYEVEAEVLAI
ncbi:MAG: serine acetyltransferase [Pedobacter sp.]|nr:MAG: serine acetyltransferase [Pedobacter sp.]